jgi:hypothetical protein
MTLWTVFVKMTDANYVLIIDSIGFSKITGPAAYPTHFQSGRLQGRVITVLAQDHSAFDAVIILCPTDNLTYGHCN